MTPKDIQWLPVTGKINIGKIQVNIACGINYIEDWINLDHIPVSPAIKKANLLGRLPFEDNSVDVLYSSHFLEHVPVIKVPSFLNECFRVLKSGGQIRLVLPDLQEICREYLCRRESGDHKKADFVVLELLDQCVRMETGGELGAYYQSLLSDISDDGMQMIDYVENRTGENIKIAEGHKEIKPSVARILSALKNFQMIIYKVERIYCRMIVSLLPKAFREQNVSFVATGERHAWLYDFYKLHQILEQSGYKDICKLRFNESGIEGFPLYPLDMTVDSKPRKGKESMYVEARKH